jgi:hypothetical protein
MEQQYEALLQVFRHQLGLAEELQYSFIVSEFEREAGFPISHSPVFSSFQTVSMAFATEAHIVKDNLLLKEGWNIFN